MKARLFSCLWKDPDYRDREFRDRFDPKEDRPINLNLDDDNEEKNDDKAEGDYEEGNVASERFHSPELSASPS